MLARAVIGVLALAGLSAAPSTAQRLHASRIDFAPQMAAAHTPRPVADSATEPDHGAMTVAGVLGAAAGLLAGVYTGSRLEGNCGCDDPGLFGAIVGAAAGPAVTVPLFVNGANGGRGPFGREVGASVLIGGAALGMLFVAGNSTGPWPLLAAPVVEIGVVEAMEAKAAAAR